MRLPISGYLEIPLRQIQLHIREISAWNTTMISQSLVRKLPPFGTWIRTMDFGLRDEFCRRKANRLVFGRMNEDLKCIQPSQRSHSSRKLRGSHEGKLLNISRMSTAELYKYT
ncbi:hypothetical protein QCA50_005477 [Cerrena zonata]|uniref:Uncharacterized protein n=1 Tax=Cerrena zonata TaxID=2478898 RepID=A0AAW0GR87_9APHY